MNCSIYFIKCLSNNKMYIGSCLNYNSRIKRHFNDLIKNKHSNKLLQADFNYYGKVNFKYGEIEVCKEENALQRENYFMDFYKTYIIENGTDFGYNMSRAARIDNFIEKDTSNYSNAFKGNINSRKLTIEQCLEIKKLLLEETEELIKDKLERISNIFNVSIGTIGLIRSGKSSYSKELNGGLKDWKLIEMDK